MKLLALLMLVCAPAWAQRPPAANPYTSADDMARGEKLYLGACQGCHGPRGDGGRGANLAVPRLARAAGEQALFNVIKNGISGTEMPRAWSMTDREIWQVAAFVRTLGRIAPQAVPGDATHGEQVYQRANCGQCHMVAGHGGRMGPDLGDIGARRSVAYLRQAILEPEADLPNTFLQVRMVAKDGRRVQGVRLNEDTFSVQVRDLSDNLHSFWKNELAELHRERGKSPMPSYRTVFTPAELDDLVAYLVSLRGEL